MVGGANCFAWPSFRALLVALTLSPRARCFTALDSAARRDAIKTDVTVAQASVSPFRNVVLHDLKVHPRGSEPLLTVKEIRLRYGLLSIIRGKIDVEEVTVESPVITWSRTRTARAISMRCANWVGRRRSRPKNLPRRRR